MSSSTWFDPASNAPIFSTYLEKIQGWQQAMEDGIITADELEVQAQKVTRLLQELEPKLKDELHDQITQVLLELALYYGMQHESILHDLGAED